MKNVDADIWDRITTILSKPEHYGHSTWRLGNMLGMSTKDARKVLVQMERHGRVVRNERLSSCNNTYWGLK